MQYKDKEFKADATVVRRPYVEVSTCCSKVFHDQHGVDALATSVRPGYLYCPPCTKSVPLERPWDSSCQGQGGAIDCHWASISSHVTELVLSCYSPAVPTASVSKVALAVASAAGLAKEALLIPSLRPNTTATATYHSWPELPLESLQ